MLRWSVKILAFAASTLIGIVAFGPDRFLPFGALLCAAIVEGVDWLVGRVA